MARCSQRELRALLGADERTAKRLFCALSIGRGALCEPESKQPSLGNSREAYRYLLPRVGWPEEEEFWILALDLRQSPLGLWLVAKGGTAEVNLTLSGLFKHLVRVGAPRGICCHTHPSGDSTPSDVDLTLTDRICETGDILGVEIVDHLILGQGTYTSLADSGYM